MRKIRNGIKENKVKKKRYHACICIQHAVQFMQIVCVNAFISEFFLLCNAA